MEIPTSTHPGLISKSQTEEKARFTTAVSKITPVINLIKKMYGKSRLMKFIRTDYSTYKKTQSPIVILDNIKINHPLVKLMADYVKKLDLIGDSSKFFMILVGNILEEVLLLLDRGVKASTLSEILHEISSDIFDLTSDLSDNLEFINNGQINEIFLKKVLESLIKEPIPRQLLQEAILKTSSFNLEKIRICKIPSGSLEESQIVNGMIFEREPEGKIKGIKEGSTSIYNAPIDVPRGELKSVVQLESADQLRSFSRDEIIEMKKKISNLKSDVLIFSGRINEIYLDLLNKENKFIFKILSKHDLRRLRDLLGGSISQEFGEEGVKGKVKEIKVITLGNKKYTQFINNKNEDEGGDNDDGNDEGVDKVVNNEGDKVVNKEGVDKVINDSDNDKVVNNKEDNHKILNKESKSLNVCSIILRHSLEYRLDDIERNLNKALIALQRNVKNEKLQVCPGKGQFEKRLGEIFFKLSKESLEKYNEGEDLLEKHLIYESLYKSMPTNEVKDDSIDIYSAKVKAICYALEFVGTVFEIEDYLIGIPPKLNVRPQMNQDWDEDH